MDAKQACDKLNGFNFQNRYLVGKLNEHHPPTLRCMRDGDMLTRCPVLYHQPDKMARSKEDMEVRKENLERLKKQHGID